MSSVRRQLLTIVLFSDTYPDFESRSREGRQPGDSGWRSECGARGRGLVSVVPGRLWASACRHYDRHARCIAVNGASAGRSEARHLRRLSREAWPEAEPLGCVSPSGQNRGGTPEVVLPPPVSSPARGEDEGGGSAASQDAVVTEQRLTAFRFLFSFVARMERSEIRERHSSFLIVPGFRFCSIRATAQTRS